MKLETRPDIHMEKQLRWACKVGGTESLGISRAEKSVSQIDGISDMAPVCWLHRSVGGGFRKGRMASACLDARHFSFSLYTTCAF